MFSKNYKKCGSTSRFSVEVVARNGPWAGGRGVRIFYLASPIFILHSFFFVVLLFSCYYQRPVSFRHKSSAFTLIPNNFRTRYLSWNLVLNIISVITSYSHLIIPFTFERDECLFLNGSTVLCSDVISSIRIWSLLFLCKMWSN